MLDSYRAAGDRLALAGSSPEHLGDDVFWVDALRPTRDEELAVERFIGAELPTPEEMNEIEPSSRLSVENGTFYLTAALICGADQPNPSVAAVTFILAGKRLVTLRYSEPGSFRMAKARLAKHGGGLLDANGALEAVLDAVVDRTADSLERISGRVEIIARHIFEVDGAGRRRRRNFNGALRNIGWEGLRLAQIAESLTSVQRLVLFLLERVGERFSREDRSRFGTMLRDIEALLSHSRGLDERVTFLLDATLGLVTLEQNDTIKIFSVLAVIFMPPTLIASIYGMNFDHMPELHWRFGYPFALGIMLTVSVLTYLLFRWRRWL